MTTEPSNHRIWFYVKCSLQKRGGEAIDSCQANQPGTSRQIFAKAREIFDLKVYNLVFSTGIVSLNSE